MRSIGKSLITVLGYLMISACSGEQSSPLLYGTDKVDGALKQRIEVTELPKCVLNLNCGSRTFNLERYCRRFHTGYIGQLEVCLADYDAPKIWNCHYNDIDTQKNLLKMMQLNMHITKHRCLTG